MPTSRFLWGSYLRHDTCWVHLAALTGHAPFSVSAASLLFLFSTFRVFTASSSPTRTHSSVRICLRASTSALWLSGPLSYVSPAARFASVTGEWTQVFIDLPRIFCLGRLAGQYCDILMGVRIGKTLKKTSSFGNNFQGESSRRERCEVPSDIFERTMKCI